MHDLPTLGIPGADTVAQTLTAQIVRDVAVLVVIREPDQDGRVSVAGVRDRLRGLEWEGHLVIVDPPDGRKDLNDWYRTDRAGFRGSFEATLMAAFEGAVAGEPELPAETAPDDGFVWVEPEDRGYAVLSELGGVEYIEDLIRPGRIVVWAAEEGTGKSYAVNGELAIRVRLPGARSPERGRWFGTARCSC
jgi:hypothetical protein